MVPVRRESALVGVGAALSGISGKYVSAGHGRTVFRPPRPRYRAGRL